MEAFFYAVDFRQAFFEYFPSTALLFAAVASNAAQGGNAGSVRGTVTDQSGAVIPGATVHLTNAISGLDRSVTTDGTGQFEIDNVPFNNYSLSASASGFASQSQNFSLRSAVGISLKLVLQIEAAASTVTVEASGDLVETDPTFHTDVDRDMFIKVPLESQSSSLSSLVTLTTPGVAADSNGLFHGLGDHASNSFSIDGQSITDQQSKVFSNQLPSNSIQSIQVISGAPPAEYGGKTSLVIVATTRSGQGVTKPTGSVTASYGSFGSASAGFDLSYGGKNWGNFVEVDGLNTGRFLDPPEFTVFHAKGNLENVFDRVDYSLTPVDSIHVDFNYSRSWFQTPNSYDNLNVQNVVSGRHQRQPGLRQRGQHRPALADRDLQHLADLYARHRQRLRLQLGRFRPQGQLQLLSQQQPAGRSWTAESANRFDCTESHPHQCRGPFGFLLCQGNPHHQDRCAVRADLPARERQPRRRRIDLRLQRSLRGCRRQSLAGLLRSLGMPHRRESELPSGARALRSDPGRRCLQILRPHRRQGTGSLRRRPDQNRQLALQPGPARGRVQRPHGCQPDTTPRRHCLQHQAVRDCAARLLRTHP